MLRRTRVERFFLAVVRPLVLALLLPLASSGTLPVWVRMLAPDVHVCHCHRDHSDCVCEKCNPELRKVVISDEQIKGRCGDDDPAFGGVGLPSLPPSPFVSVLPARLVGRLVADYEDLFSWPWRDPEKPPPRSIA